MRDVSRTREQFVNDEPQASDLRIFPVFYQNANNLEDERFFHEFTATINHNWMTIRARALIWLLYKNKYVKICKDNLEKC